MCMCMTMFDDCMTQWSRHNGHDTVPTGICSIMAVNSTTNIPQSFLDLLQRDEWSATSFAVIVIFCVCVLALACFAIFYCCCPFCNTSNTKKAKVGPMKSGHQNLYFS